MKTTFSVALFGVFSIVLMILVVQWGTGSTESSLVDHEQVGVVLTAPLVKGKITLGDGDQELGEAVRTSLAEGARKIVINFSKVSYLDSSGVGELVGCFTSIKGKGGELRICGMSSKIFNLIKMTSLHSVFEVKDTEEEALAGF